MLGGPASTAIQNQELGSQGHDGSLTILSSEFYDGTCWHSPCRGQNPLSSQPQIALKNDQQKKYPGESHADFVFD